MKKIRILLILFLGIIFLGACDREYLPTPNSDDGHQISIKTTSLAISDNADSTLVERGVVVNFKAVSNEPEIISWQWNFEDDSSFLIGQEVSHVFWSQPPSVVEVKLLGVDTDNNQFHASEIFKVVWSVDGLPAVKWISSTIVPNSTKYQIVLAFNKAGMKYSGSKYFYIGSMSDWQPVNILAPDTNYLVVGDSLISPATGDVGKYVAVRLALDPNAYKIGVGKIVNGEQMWGNFYDSTMLKFSLSNTGIVSLNSQYIPSKIPGSIGDAVNDSSVLRFDISDSLLIIYVNNQNLFTNLKSFIVFQDSNGVWNEPILEEALSDFPNWGKYKLKRTSSIISRILVMRFGPNIDSSGVYNSNLQYSSYWDSYYQVLKAQFKNTGLKSGKKAWTIVPI